MASKKNVLKKSSGKVAKKVVKVTSIGFAVPLSTLPKIDAAAKRKGITRSKFMRQAVLASL